MLYNFRKTINTKIFNFFARGVLSSPKVKCDDNSSTVILSQLCSRDLMMYLVAIKTFTRYVVPHKIIVVGDRLTDMDNTILRQHIDNIEIINIVDVITDNFPTGGCWERLLTIIDKCKDNYVVQLDADTITLSMPEEALQCIKDNRSFTLGTDMGQKVITFQDASRLLQEQGIKSQHVQVLAELAMEEIDQENNLKYIRGCAAFAGFSRNGASREQIKIISSSIEQKIGKNKWQEWGSEQVASNIVIANSINPMVLSVNKYHYFKPGVDFKQFHLLHFVGTNRFSGGVYTNLASKKVKMLKSQPML